MEFIIDKNCSNLENVEIVSSYMTPFLCELLNSLNVLSLDYFVVADSEEKSYANTVMKYASIVGTEASVTQDGQYFAAGKALNGIDEDGRLHQAIVIKDSIWVCAGLEYMRLQGRLPEEILERLQPNYISLTTIIHEIGHIIDHENQYKMFGTVNTKIAYDLRYEYDEYITQKALSLWGEYYAEMIAYQIVCSEEDLTINKEKELIKCIKTFSYGTDTHAILERVYRILYYFVSRLAYIHQRSNHTSSFDYSAFEKIELVSDYIPLLARTELAIIELYRNYPKWDTDDCFNEFSNVIKEFLNFEHKRQLK